MFQRSWRHPGLGLLALLIVLLGIATLVWGATDPERQRSQEFTVLYVLAMVASGYLLIGWFLPFAVGRTRPDTAQRVAQVQASGSMLASSWCSARIGWVSMRGPLLRVSVYPGGIVLQPLLMASRAILASELIGVDDAAPVFGWLGPASVRIRHTAPDVRATVRLHIGRASQLAAAIRMLSHD